ncbi:MAG: FeoB-associated Cys-rich membrane protein [Planctomycetaceae bacterium]|nr:FeoB-associated Cys-rich membrane protein [Planctomycetaceae bacterium]
MSESLQLGLVIAIVGLAMLYIGRRLVRALIGRSGSGCTTGCGKCAANEPAVIGIQPLGEKRN